MGRVKLMTMYKVSKMDEIDMKLGDLEFEKQKLEQQMDALDRDLILIEESITDLLNMREAYETD